MSRPRSRVQHPSKVVRELLRLFDQSGMTQAEMAERAGISQSTVSNLRKGEKAYSSISHIEWIGQVLGYHLEWVQNEQPAEYLTAADATRPGHNRGLE